MVAINRPVKPKFPLGQLLATPGALQVLAQSGETPEAFLNRHVRGDWGEISEGDKELNEEALRDGSRIMSAYRTSNGSRIWVITEASDDRGVRCATTILLPEEY